MTETTPATGSPVQDRMDVILRRLRNLTAPLTGLALLGAMVAISFYAPVEATQGVVQKIFYVHVASAWSSYLAFFITTWKRRY